jgi:antirestriction protein ArdC
MKGYTVFNCEQIGGLPAQFYAKASPPLPAPARITAADQFAAGTRAIFTAAAHAQRASDYLHGLQDPDAKS